MRDIRTLVGRHGATLVIASAMLLNACSSKEAAAPQATAGPPYEIVTDMKQLMAWIMEPNAQVVWKSVGTVITVDGRQEIEPKTDQDWEAVRNSAATVAEMGNLLMMEGRARNQDDWIRKSRALIDTAVVVLKAAEAKDAAAVFTSGSDMYLACSGCHGVYAFPQ